MPRVPIPQSQGRRWRLLQSNAHTRAAQLIPSTFHYSQHPASLNRTTSMSSENRISAIPDKVVQAIVKVTPKPPNLANSNLQTVLKWENNLYAAVQAFVVEQAKSKLDVGKGVRSQDKGKLDKLKETASHSMIQITK
ncbi:hypothetical protein CPB83DRAFT_898106 [Crepidotus variabilis]|uniref:Uncharacterized protein n=1 Tax=Crepidotus variabilis TaxID=179855 RepID=A0A9P6E7Y6_9AGAR|nr:hypothetical protein CPB83DRAFT_898106 [Crepidotus variabilis]